MVRKIINESDGVMKQTSKKRLYIDALPLTTARASGIGHMLANIVHEFTKNEKLTDEYEIVLFGPAKGRVHVDAWGFDNVIYKPQPLPQKLVTLLNFVHLLPPVDLWLGKGVYLFGNFVNYPLTRKSKSITYVHDLCYLHYPEFLRPKVRRVLRNMLPGWMKRTNAIVTVSQDAKDDIGRFYPQLLPKTHVVLNAVDTSLFYPRSAAEVDTVREKYGIPAKYILFVGNVEPRKNLERLVESFRLLPASLRGGCSLVIVGGEGWLNEPINRAIEAARQDGCSIIRPKDYVGDDDLPALFTGADLSVLVSVHEGFGMPALESMACATPALVSNIASIREAVGDAGYYVDPLDVADMRRGLEHMLRSAEDRSKLIQAGPRQAAKFKWEATARQLYQLVVSLDRE